MIERIVREELIAMPQEGEAVLFKRRTPDQSNLASCTVGDMSCWYDQIRMLDAEGYPHAYIEVCGMHLSFAVFHSEVTAFMRMSELYQCHNINLLINPPLHDYRDCRSFNRF